MNSFSQEKRRGHADHKQQTVELHHHCGRQSTGKSMSSTANEHDVAANQKHMDYMHDALGILDVNVAALKKSCFETKQQKAIFENVYGWTKNLPVDTKCRYRISETPSTQNEASKVSTQWITSIQHDHPGTLEIHDSNPPPTSYWKNSSVWPRPSYSRCFPAHVEKKFVEA